MRHTEWFWTTGDGARLYAQSWEPREAVLGAIGLIHGHGDHSGRYAHVAAALGEAGYATLAFDHRGHGQSSGQRGHVPSYETFMDDVARLMDEVARRYPDRPRFLYGQSMGGNLAINYALRRRPPITGVVATSPWLRLAFEPPAIKVALGRVMERIAPTFAQASGLDTAAIARDPAEVRAYASDPLNHDRISARLFSAVYAAGLWALDHAGELTVPLLLIHGGADRVTSAAASREFAARAPGCTFRQWDQCYHEIHNEPERDELFTCVREWLRATAPAAAV